MESPQIYSELRFLKELDTFTFRKIEESLEFEINIYEELPNMLHRNYETIDHFLDYIIIVKNYRETLEQTGNRVPDF